MKGLPMAIRSAWPRARIASQASAGLEPAAGDQRTVEGIAQQPASSSRGSWIQSSSGSRYAESHAALCSSRASQRIGRHRIGVGDHVVGLAVGRLAHGDALRADFGGHGIDHLEQQAVAVGQRAAVGVVAVFRAGQRNWSSR
jgi:hypothetical protein